MTHSENNAQAIAGILARFVADELIGDGSSVEADENLLGDGLVDSLGMLRLVGFIESSFDVQVKPDQFTIENFRNLDVISGYVVRLIGESAG